MINYVGDAEFENSIKDSLRRQIVEVKKQIQEEKNKQAPQLLDKRRRNDLLKAAVVINYLKQKKRLVDFQQTAREAQKQWKLEVQQSHMQVMVSFTQQYSVYLKQQGFIRQGYLQKAYNILSELVLDRNLLICSDSENASEEEKTPQKALIGNTLQANIEELTQEMQSFKNKTWNFDPEILAISMIKDSKELTSQMCSQKQAYQQEQSHSDRILYSDASVQVEETPLDSQPQIIEQDPIQVLSIEKESTTKHRSFWGRLCRCFKV